MKDMQDRWLRILWGKWLNETPKNVCALMFTINRLFVTVLQFLLTAVLFKSWLPKKKNWTSQQKTPQQQEKAKTATLHPPARSLSLNFQCTRKYTSTYTNICKESCPLECLEKERVFWLTLWEVLHKEQ